MKNVFELTEKFVAEEKEIMEICKEQMNLSNLADMGFEEFKVITKTLKLMDMANELIVEQARLLVAMDEKLNRLLKQKEEA